MEGTDVVHMVTVHAVCLHHSMQRMQLFPSILSLFLQWRHNMATDSELREGRRKWSLLSADFGIIELPLFCLTGEFIITYIFPSAPLSIMQH